MAVRHRTSLSISSQIVQRAAADALDEAIDAHLANIAATLASMWLNHYRSGRCSLFTAMLELEPFASAAGARGEAVLAQFVRDVVSSPEPVRKRGGKSHPDGLRFCGWALVDGFARQGYPIQDRQGEGEAEAFVMAADELRRTGLGDFSAAAVRGMWEGERDRWVKRARNC